jgi:chromate transporter
LLFASLAVVAIFLPGFLLVSGFLPFWNQVMNNRRGQLAVAGTNAGVVGLLAAALYDPILISSVSSVTNGAIVLFGILAMQFGRVSPLYIVLGCLVVYGLLGIL